MQYTPILPRIWRALFHKTGIPTPRVAIEPRITTDGHRIWRIEATIKGRAHIIANIDAEDEADGERDCN